MSDDSILFRKRFRTLSVSFVSDMEKQEKEALLKQAKWAYDKAGIQISRQERLALYRLQALLEESVDEPLCAKLERLGEAMINRPDKRKKKLVYQLPPMGAVMVKYWRGKRLEIKRTEHGFEYQGKHYDSLSRLARDIAGYAVSGPIFFGLRKAKGMVA